MRHWMLRLSLVAAAAIVIPACGRTLIATTSPYSISTPTLASGVVGVAYVQTLTTVSETAPVTWSVLAGALPGGLTLNAATGQITGSPTGSAGISSVQIRAVDASGAVAQKSFTILVTGGLAAGLTVTTATPLPGADVGTAYDFGFSASGGAPFYSWTVVAGTFPTGLSLNGANGGLSGVPTTAGTFNFTIQVTDTALATASLPVSLTVSNPLQITSVTMPAGSVGGAYSQNAPVINGATPFLYSLHSGALPAGLSLNAATGAISGTPTLNGASAFSVRVTDAAGVSLIANLSMIVNPAPIVTPIVLPPSTQGLAYSQTLNATLGTGAYTWTVTAGALPNGLNLSSGGAIGGISTAAGTFNFTVTVTDAANGTGSRALSIVINPPVVVTTASLAAWTTTRPGYSQTLAATGGTGALTWSITGSLPAGLTLNAATGAITGTPTGSSTFTAVATDTLGATGSQLLTITINALPAITTGSLPDWTQNFAFTPVTLGTTGGTPPFGFSSTGSFPTGMTLGASTGVVGGTPSVANSFSFTITLLDAAGASTSQNYTVVINPAMVVTTTTPLAPWTQNKTGFSQTLVVTGGTGAKTWSGGAGLPTGLTLSSAGVISGTPTSVGNANFSVTVTDNVGATAGKTFDLLINPPPAITTSSPVTAWTQGFAGYSVAFAGTGGTGALTWTNPGGGLPAGMSLSGAGVLTGTPTAAGTFPFNVVATDTVSAATASTPFSITINPPLAITSSGALAAWTKDKTLYSQTLTATGGTGAKTWSQAGGTLPNGLSLSTGGVISGTPTVAGTFNFNVQVTDSIGATAPASVPLSITINPALAITNSGAQTPWTQNFAGYSVTLAATGGTGTKTWSNPSGALPGGLTLSSSGVISGTPTAAGNFSFQVQVADSVGAVAPAPAPVTLSILINPPPSFTISSPLTAWDQNLAGYSVTLTGTGGTGGLTFSNPGGGLPAGLSFAAGVISGTPTGTGTSTFNLQLTDGIGATTGTVSYSITINPPPSVTSTAPLAAWTQDLAGYNVALTATGGTGALVWTNPGGGLPAGLSLSSAGVITGTPTSAGTNISFNVVATDSLGVASPSQGLTITINPPVSITTTTLAAWTQNKSSYNQSLVATGGTGTLTWSVISGTFPSSLTFNSAGSITGTPTNIPGGYTFTVQATDSLGAVDPTPQSLTITINPPLVVTTSSLANWTQFQGGYSQTLAVTGGTGAHTWAFTGGSLPVGLSLDTSTGVISGTPTGGPAGYTVFVQATDSVGATSSPSTSLSMTLNPPLNLSGPFTLQGWTTGRPSYNATPNLSGGTPNLTWTLPGNPLPGGLSMSSSTGAITGTPTGLTGPFSFDIRVTDATTAFVQQTFSITINPAIAITTGPTLPDALQNIAYGPLQFLKSNGTDPVTWTSNIGTAPIPGMSFNSSGQLSGTPTTGGTYPLNVTATDIAGSSNTIGVSLFVLAPLTVTTATLPDATATNSYAATPSLAASGGKAPYTWSLLSGTPPPGISFVAGGSWGGNAPTFNGSFTFVVRVTDVDSRVADRALKINVTGGTAGNVSILGSSLKSGTQGASYFDGLTGQGGNPAAYAWTLINATTLPAGLSLDGSTGAITGTPSASGGTSFDVQLTDGSTTATATLSININPPLSVGTVTPMQAWTANAPNAYSQSNSTLGGTSPFTWSKTGSLPNGLTMDAAGAITGTPTAPGTFFFTVQVTDAAGATANKALSIQINPPPLLNAFGLPQGTKDTAYPGATFTVGGSTGTAPFTFTSSPVSPFFTGIALSSGGSLSGTPASSGTVNPLTVTVTDAAGSTDNRAFTLTINPAPTISNVNPPDATLNTTYPGFQVSGSGGTGTLTFTLFSGSLPTGLTLGSNGFISGTATAGSGPFGFTVRATDSVGATVNQPLTINVTSGPTVISSNLNNGQVGVSRGTNLRLQFSTAMKQSTFTSSSVTINPDPSGGAIAAPISFYWTAPDTVTLVFDTQLPLGIFGDDLLAAGQLYSVTLDTTIQSQANVNLSASIVRTFTTQTTNPNPNFTVTPDLNDPVPPLNTQFQFTFDQTMNPAQGSVAFESVTGNKIQGDLPGPGDFSSMVWNSPTNTVLTVTLNTPLPPNSLFRVKLNSFNSASNSSLNSDDHLIAVTAGPSGAPSATGILPASAGTVSRDSEVAIGFTAPMWPADLLDPALVTVTGAGVSGIQIDRELVEFSGIFLKPRSAWPASTTVTVTVKAAVRGANGDPVGTDQVFTFTTDAGNSTPFVIDGPFSSLTTGAVDLDNFGFNANFRFKTGVSTRVHINRQTLAPRDISLFEHLTGIPMKGYSISGSHGLELQTNQDFSGMEFSTQYDLFFFPTFLDSQGNAMDTTGSANLLTFTTRASGGGLQAARPIIYSGGDSRYTTKPNGGVKAELELQVASPSGSGLTVTAVDAPDAGFTPSLGSSPPNFGSSNLNYSSSGTEAALTTAGQHVLTYTLSDTVHSVPMNQKLWVFDKNKYPALNTPADSATPTLTWPAVDPALGADGMAVIIGGSAGAYIVLLPPTATSFTVPADQALPGGSYSFNLHFFHFTDSRSDDASSEADSPSVSFNSP